MADYVLVHGAWGGAWAWDRLARELGERGHRAIAVDLEGLGRRRSELHGGITLTDHVDDVVRAVGQAGSIASFWSAIPMAGW